MTRKFYHFCYFLLMLLLASPNSFSQSSEAIDTDISPSKMKDRAKHAAETGDVYTALFYYEEVVKRDSNDLGAFYQLAEMHRFSRNYKKAEEIYSAIFSKAPSQYPFALYYTGLMQKMTGNYEEAKKNMTRFRKEMGRVSDRNFSTLLGKEISGCDSGMVFKEFPDNIVIENTGNSVNHPHIEFSPLLLDSTTMLFGSLRMDSMVFFDTRDDQYEKPPVRQIYKAEKINGQWEEKGKYEVFNDPHTDMGNFIYSAASQKYYFSKCSKDVKGRVTCKIYSTEKTSDGKWSHPHELTGLVNMDGFTSTQPAIVVDTVKPVTPVSKGKTNVKSKTTPKGNSKKPAPKGPTVIEYLYFVSDRPGGKGGLDIWFTTYNSARKEWTKPVNFSLVNTPGNECTPFFHIPSQTLYFSSDGNATAGGLDIYKTIRTDRKFSRPVNMAFPINSPQDDLGFTLGNEGNKGMLVSNRPGGTPYFHETCCDDIYAFEILPVKPFVCNLQLTLVESDTAGCTPQQEITLLSYDISRKNIKNEKITVTDCFYEMPLEKEWVYKFYTERAGYQRDTLIVETRDMCAAEVILKKLPVNKVKKEISVYNEIPQEGKTFVLKDIQYDYDSHALSPAAIAAIDSVLIPLLKKYPTDKLVISSHTDNQGSHKYNHNLSQKRAESVVNYLVSKGIDHKRLHAKGYGETKPIMPNQNPDGSDNPLGRAMNRRTEFLLLKEHDKIPH